MSTILNLISYVKKLKFLIKDIYHVYPKAKNALNKF
jgi:hypothetical protein